MIDLDAPYAVKPEIVFAVPSYLLNGRMVALGNPEPEELSAMVRAFPQVHQKV